MGLMRSLAAASLIAGASAAVSQVHIALGGLDSATGVSNGMNIAWKSDSASLTSSVLYGPSATSLTTLATGGKLQYLANHGYHHSVTLQNLGCSQTVFYKCGDDADGWSSVNSFTTAPCADEDKPVRISIFGDMGWLDSTQRPMKFALDGLQKVWSAQYSYDRLQSLVASDSIDMFLHLGDIGCT